MRHFYFVNIILLLSINLLSATKIPKSAVVYYGKDIPYSLIGVHDYIILEPSNTKTYTHGFKKYQNSIYAYVSIGEMLKSKKYFKKVNSSWILGKNRVWKSYIMDISNKDYQDFLLQNVIKPLYDRGFKNFFFDTLDSYMIVIKNTQDQKKYQTSLVTFIKRFKQNFPNSKLIINRGFEIVDKIHNSIDAILFESFYYGLDSKLRYKKVSKDDQKWLLTQIERIKRYNIDIIALDYLPHLEKEKAKKAIKIINQYGMIAYIAQSDLQSVGVSSKNGIKREVLLLSNPINKSDPINTTSAHRLASVALEYLGFIPIVKKASNIDKNLSTKNYAAIIVWFDQKLDDYDSFAKWILKEIKDGQKVIFFGNYSFDLSNDFIKELGIKLQNNLAKQDDIKNNILVKDSMIGYEIEPSISHAPYMIEPNSTKNLLTYKNSKSQISTIAAIMPWGGYVLNDALYYTFLDSDLLVIDLFKFYKQALNIKDFPIPDPTTENGKRLFFVHIDGDGSANKVEGEKDLLSIELIYEKFLKKYQIPQSVSIVEAELAQYGLYPKLSKRLQESAKKIYKLPYIDAATHTFSHPFFWKNIKNGYLNPTYHLPVKNYKFNLEREIKGSLEYINTKLLPKDKKKANTIFFTGDCMPTKEALEYIYKNGFNNLNGGDTEIRNLMPWSSKIQPFGIKIGDFYQIYTAQQNENIYTNEWLGPFWGFRQVIQTFKLTNKPKRLKALNIYYHFYSGSKLASINALKDVYEWTLKQDTMPIYATEYSPKVLDFYNASITKFKNYWLIVGLHDLKTLRVSNKLGFVDIDKSVGVIGKKREKDFEYIHLAPAKKHLLYISKIAHDDQNHLISSNAKVLKYKKEQKNIQFKLQSYVDLKFSYHVAKNCSITTIPKASKIQKTNQTYLFLFQNIKDVDVNIVCK